MKVKEEVKGEEKQHEEAKEETKKVEVKEEPKEEPKAAAPGLAVDVDAATGAGAAPLVSPGFKELLETPRAADGADGGATSSPLAGFKGSTPRDGGAKGAAVPSGRRRRACLLYTSPSPRDS